MSKAKDVVSFEKIETVPISSKHFHAFLINEKKVVDVKTSNHKGHDAYILPRAS